jgi:hypothetical protein
MGVNWSRKLIGKGPQVLSGSEIPHPLIIPRIQSREFHPMGGLGARDLSMGGTPSTLPVTCFFPMSEQAANRRARARHISFNFTVYNI